MVLGDFLVHLFGVVLRERHRAIEPGKDAQFLIKANRFRLQKRQRLAFIERAFPNARLIGKNQVEITVDVELGEAERYAVIILPDEGKRRRVHRKHTGLNEREDPVHTKVGIIKICHLETIVAQKAFQDLRPYRDAPHDPHKEHFAIDPSLRHEVGRER